GEGRQKAPRRGPTTTTIASSSNNSPNPSVVGDDEKMSKTPRDESASDVVPRAIAFEETPPSKVEDTPDRADQSSTRVIIVGRETLITRSGCVGLVGRTALLQCIGIVMAGKRKRGSEEAPSSPVAPTRARKVAVKKGGKTAPREGEMFYLFKSEPESRFEKGMDMKFSIDDLIASENGTAEWDGVRNYQARNLMREMKVGDRGFFYHSNCKPPGIVGIVE
ncbi:Thymocyte nuclear protein 1, partial [Perkinsus olseni]